LGFCEFINPILLETNAIIPIFTEHRFAAKSKATILSDERFLASPVVRVGSAVRLSSPRTQRP
jgi:hypothetical protein